MSGDEQMWAPVTAADVTDEKLASGEVRALRREVRDGFDAIARSLTAFERIEGKLDVIVDRQNHIERRVEAQDRRIDAMEQRLAHLEAWTKDRSP